MKLRERLEQIKPLIETTEKVGMMIAWSGILTGSYAFGVDTPESDRDLIVPGWEHIDLTMGKIVNLHNGIYLHRNDDLDLHYDEEQFESCYVLYRRNIYNLLLMKEERYFDAWNYATKEMIKRIAVDPQLKEKIRDKLFRVELFEHLKFDFLNLM